MWCWVLMGDLVCCHLLQSIPTASPYCLSFLMLCLLGITVSVMLCTYFSVASCSAADYEQRPGDASRWWCHNYIISHHPSESHRLSNSQPSTRASWAAWTPWAPCTSAFPRCPNPSTPGCYCKPWRCCIRSKLHVGRYSDKLAERVYQHAVQ